MRQVDHRDLSEEHVEKWRKLRWRCRTDLLFLAQRILNYKHVDIDPHWPILDILQKFPNPRNIKESEEHDVFNRRTGQWEYKPLTSLINLTGKRRRMILDPRGHLKTTINCQSHSIQWVLNYPGIAIQIIQSTIEKAQDVVKEVREHFVVNERFREVFPELCPQKRLADFGTLDGFEIPNREKYLDRPRREKTISIGSIDKGTSGYHYDVMKFSDIVEPTNIKTSAMIKSVIANFYMQENLLVAPGYWIDVEGTRYTHNDLYGKLVDQWLEEKSSGLVPEYDIHVRSCWLKKFAKDDPYAKFTPDRLDEDEFEDDKKHWVPIWPIDNEKQARFPRKKLLQMQKKDAYIYSCQQLNNPIGGRGGQVIFPVKVGYRPRFITPEQFRNVRIRETEMTVDTAETINEGSKYSAITVGSWDRPGRLYIRQIVHGKFLALDLCHRIIATWKIYRPNIVKIEETSFVRGLMPTLYREMSMEGVDMNLEFLKRDNNVAKIERIENTLQPWYKQGLLVFLTSIEKKALVHLVKELKEFPLGEYMDILDTLSDFFQKREDFGHPGPTPERKRDEYKFLVEKMLGIENPFDPMNDLVPDNGVPLHSHYRSTGGL